MHVKDVRTIYSEPGSEVANQTKRQPRGLSKRIHRDICGARFRRKYPWMAGAIDRRLMTFNLLLARKVDGEALYSSKFQTRYELNDFHLARTVGRWYPRSKASRANLLRCNTNYPRLQVQWQIAVHE